MKEQLIKAISQLVSEIRTMLLDARISASSIAFKMSKLEEATEKQLEVCRVWLVGFRESYVKKYEKARYAVPEQVWQMYRNLGTKGTYEQIQLKDAKDLMVEEWTKRPHQLTRKSDGIKKSSKGKSKKFGKSSKSISQSS